MEHQTTRRPDLPLSDENGFALLEYDCWRCQRSGWASEPVVDLYRAADLRLLCLPCHAPERWKWRVDEQGREYLQPLPRPRTTTKRYGDAEAQELEMRHAELFDRLERRATLRDVLANVTDELSRVDTRIASLEALLPTLQSKVSAIQTDPHLDARRRADALRAQIVKLEASLAGERRPGSGTY